MTNQARQTSPRSTSRQNAPRSRSGSVLILVVALLVLMALIGTAWISTTRTDRYAAVQHSVNTEIELLVEGVVRMAQAALGNDLFQTSGGASAYRPAPDAPPLTGAPLPPSAYRHTDSPGTDLYLASRTPTLRGVDAPPTALSGSLTANPPLWRHLSYPFTYSVTGSTPPQFDRPDSGPPLLLPPLADGTAPPNLVPGAKSDFYFAPTTMQFNGRASWPALEAWYIDRANGRDIRLTAATGPIPAADVDGDGVADAGLWKLPIGEVNGVTYFAAARIVDNGAAVNASTAWKPNTEFRDTSTTDVPGDFFTANVDLQGLLYARGMTGNAKTVYQHRQMHILNMHRFSGAPFKGAVFAQDGAITDPIEDNLSKPRAPGRSRSDYAYVSIYDQFYHQLARRLGVPGQYVLSPNRRFQALASGDASKLAYKFLMYTSEDAKYPSGIDKHLEYSIHESSGLRRTGSDPYSPAESLQWFIENFDWANAAPAARDIWSRRALLVARNSVANLAPAQNITAVLPPENWASFLPGGTDPSEPPRGSPEWDALVRKQKMPGGDLTGGRAMRKASINTADFPELWRAFWMVMAHKEAASGTTNRPPFPVAAGDLTPLGRRMFRSVIRDPRRQNNKNSPPRGTPNPGDIEELTPSQMLMLRSAIAAVNAMDIRDSDDDVTSRRIILVDDTIASKPPLYEVTVYGTEKQPFITEVYVDNNNKTIYPLATTPNPKGYIAIELHNPHSTPIDIGGWTLGIIDRRGPAAPPGPVVTGPTAPLPPANKAFPSMTIRPITGFTGFPPGTMVPATGHLVIDNYNVASGVLGAPPVDPLADAQGRPTLVFPVAPTVAPRYVHNLHEVVFDPDLPANASGELVLLRPRRADGLTINKRTAGAPAMIQRSPVFGSEGVTLPINLAEMIPVDSHDFTGYSLAPIVAPPEGATFTAWHYARRNGIGGGPGEAAWRCVYPGRWDPMHPWDGAAAATKTHRQQGVEQVVTLAPGAVGGPVPLPPTFKPAPTLGAPDLLSSYEPTSIPAGYNPFAPIQLNNNFGGPNKVTASVNHFPFGGFARNGDILQVPYIGAYRIRFCDPGTLDRHPMASRTDKSYAGQFVELNAVTMDCALADDYDGDFGAPGPSDMVEQVGRFCPLSAMAPFPPAADHYRWTSDLFDYLTVQSPADDYGPNVGPNDYRSDYGTTAADAPPPNSTSPYGAKVAPSPNSPSGYAYTSLAAPAPALNAPSTSTPAAPNRGNEDLVPVEGLVNINTASWRVLAALPMIVNPSTGAIDEAENTALAKAIVNYRDGNLADASSPPPAGPFQSLFDLNKVREFATGNSLRNNSRYHLIQLGGNAAAQEAAWTAFDPNRNQGDLSGTTATTGDGISRDFEARFLMMNRISNLVTTRSDSYTVYLLVQGWRGVGTRNPELVVQRRRAFIADRSGVTPGNREVPAQFFYND